MTDILLVHQNFPGQFPHIADALVKRGDRVAAIGGPTAKGRPGVDLRRWDNRRGTTTGILPAAVRAEADLIRAQAAAATALALKRDGFTPQLIVGHPGWGETLYLQEVWPGVPLIVLGEMFYRPRGGDSDFDPEFGQLDFAEAMRITAKGATQSLAYAQAERIICPTPFQAASFPPGLRATIRVLHEGLDLSRARRRATARVTLPGGRVLDGSRPLVTFVSRTLEPLRGFHVVLRALPRFLADCGEAEVLVIGRPALRGYGLPSPDGVSWKSWLLRELDGRIDLDRVHFVDQVDHPTLIDAFSLSAAHVYYTYPFVLSWSLIEAMACECLVVASDTPPVRDAVTDGVDGLLLPFFDTDALAATLTRAVREPEAFAPLRAAARRTALARFDREAGVAGWLAEIDALV